jgi:hypothetical protein
MDCPKCESMICAARKTLEEKTEELRRAQFEQSMLTLNSKTFTSEMGELHNRVLDLKDEIECIKDTIDGIRRGNFVSRIPVRRNAGAKTCGH